MPLLSLPLLLQPSYKSGLNTQGPLPFFCSLLHHGSLILPPLQWTLSGRSPDCKIFQSVFYQVSASFKMFDYWMLLETHCSPIHLFVSCFYYFSRILLLASCPPLHWLSLRFNSVIMTSASTLFVLLSKIPSDNPFFVCGGGLFLFFYTALQFSLSLSFFMV